MPDQYLFDLLAPYGRVLSVQHLKIKGFQNVKSGTRRVSMVITKSIPAILKISTLQLSFRYRGQPPFCFVCQEVGHTGKDCPKSRKAHRNTLNADLHPEDLRHKLNNVQEGDLRVKLQKVSQAAPAGAAANSSLSPPSLITADQPSKSNSTPSTTRKSSNKHDAPKSHASPSNKPNNQPLTDNESSLPSLPSLSSPSLQDTLGKLKEIFHQSTDRTAESAPDAVFATLAKETSSAAEQSTASIHTVASTTSTGFLVQLNGQVVTAKRPDAAVPQAESFEFSFKPARPLPSSSAATRSAWSDSYKQAGGIRLSGGKGRAASDSDDDVPLSKRYRRSLEGESALSLPAGMEHDSIDECLDGNSVFDPLASEQHAGGESAAIVAPIKPSEVAMSPSDPADNKTSSMTQVSTPASFLSGAKDLPSPASSQGLFKRLAVVAPVPSDPLVHSDPLDSDISFSSPTIERISGLAGQDRPSELMLTELPLLHLDPNV